jgi:hypothetical protein
VRTLLTAATAVLLTTACRTERAPTAPPPAANLPGESTTSEQPHDKLIDRAQEDIYEGVWRSAMHVDRLFGSTQPDVAYAQASGSIAPAFLWDQFNGPHLLLRFHADTPLPQLNERFSAFLGRFNPDEYIAESAPNSGAFPNSFNPLLEDQTLFGIAYHQPPTQGGRFDASLGMHVALPLDPYVKGAYVYERGQPRTGVFGWREIAFWENSLGGFGVTSRLDLERLLSQSLLVHWTGSVTRAQHSYGWQSFSTFDVVYAYSTRRALDLQLEIDGSSQASVPLHDFGAKLAYRRSIARDWLVLETRASIEWPRDVPAQQRKVSLGIGVGVEMFFGTDEFLARPVTF